MHLLLSAATAVGGTLKIRLTEGYVPAGGETFDIVNTSNRTGMFDTIDNDRFENGTERFVVEYLPGKVRVRAKACPADFDADGFVNGVDFDQYAVAFESGDIVADTDGDGFVEILESGC